MKKVSCENGHFYDADRFRACPVCGAVNYRPVPPKPVVAEQQPMTEALFPPVRVGKGPAETPAPAARAVGPVGHTEILLSGHDPAGTPPQEAPAPQHRAVDPIPPGRAQSPSEPVGESGDAGAAGLSTVLSAAVKATSAQGISALPKTTAYYDFDETIPPVAWLVCVKGCYQGEAFVCHTGGNRMGRAKEMEICLYKDPAIARDTHASIIYEPKRRQFFLQPGSGVGLLYLNGNLVFSHEELHPYDKLAMGALEFVFLPLCGESFTWDDYMTGE